MLDFCWVMAGPLATKLLGDYGATVVRVETMDRVCSMRTNTPYTDSKPGVNRSGYFAFINSNKYSIQLKINRPEGKEIIKRLVLWADVVAENFAPGTMEKLGLGYNDLKQIKPDIIMVSASAQGQTGPYASHVGLGYHLAAVGGFVHISGWPDREPVYPYSPYIDLVAPYFTASAVLAALEYREKTGKGQYLDVSQFEAGIQYIGPLLLDYAVNGREAERRGNSCPSAAPYGVYRCKGEERWCAITVLDENDWASFKKVTGAGWTGDTRFADLAGRKAGEVELERLVETWTLNFTAEEVMEIMQSAGIAASVVNTPADLYNDRELRKRGQLWEIEHQEMGPTIHLGQAAVLSETPAQPRMPSPCLGQHTGYVMKEILKMEDGEFIELLNKGIFE